MRSGRVGCQTDFSSWYIAAFPRTQTVSPAPPC